MEMHRILQKVLASPRFAAFVLLSLAALGVAALDLPQGLPDREVLASWSHGTGPYVVLLGLHHLGGSLLAWVLVGALFLHAVAVHLAPGYQAPRHGPLAIAGITLIAFSVGGFAASGLLQAQPDIRDATRLSIEPVSDTAPGGRQVVEEGATYRIPGTSGDRVVAFAVLGSGPWAAERRADGTTAAHLPAPEDASPPGAVSFRVDARRPLAASAHLPGAPSLPGWATSLASILAVLAAALVLVLVGGQVPSLDPARRASMVGWMVLSLLLVLFNPLSGPGIGRVPVGTGTPGMIVHDAVVARAPVDVAPWVGAFPSTTVLAPLQAVLASAALAMLVLLALRVAAPGSGRLHRLSGQVAGALAIAGGVVLLAWALGRIPLPDTFADLSARFRHDLLTRLPVSLSVLDAAPTHAGPYSIPLASGLFLAIAPLSAGLALVLAHRTRPPRALPSPGFAVSLLAALALLRALAIALSPSVASASAAAVPLAALSALLAASALAARHLHPALPSAFLAPAVLSSALQLAIAP